MKIIITGASGFIGTNLLEYLISQGYQVFNFDKKKPKLEKFLQYWRNVDICDFDGLKKITMEVRPDYIIHLAAQTDLNENDGLDYYSANILGVENVVKVINESKTIKRVIFASSMLVNEVGYKPKGDFDYNPSTLYGESKVSGEDIVFNKLSKKIEYCVIRPTSIWGEWFGEPYKNFFDFVLSGRFFHPGEKSCTKTYGYVGNAIYQIEQLLFSQVAGVHGKVFYIGDRPAINVTEWANEVAFEAGINKPRTIPYSIFVFAGLFGDLLSKIGVKFPMTSFRLKNMTTDHIVNLDNTYMVCGIPPYSRKNGIKRTLRWLNIKTNRCAIKG